MTTERTRQMLIGRPFRPFDIYTSDGQVVTVKSPEFAWIHPSGRTMYVCPNRDVDADEVIDLLHVTKLATGKSSGGGRRRKH